MMLFGFADEATVSPDPAARKLNVDDVMPLMVVEPPPPVWATHWTTPFEPVVSTCPAAQVVEASVRFAAKVDVLLNVCAPVQVTELAAVTKPGFTNANVLLEKLSAFPTEAA